MNKTEFKKWLESKIDKCERYAERHRQGMSSTNAEFRLGSEAFYKKYLLELRVHKLALKGLEAGLE